MQVVAVTVAEGMLAAVASVTAADMLAVATAEAVVRYTVDMLAVVTAEAVVQYTVDRSAVLIAAEMDTGATPTEDRCQGVR
jgi:hypothetical protein